MKINKTHHHLSKKTLIIGVVIATCFGLAAAIYVLATNQNTTKQNSSNGLNVIDYGSSTNDQQKNGEAIKGAAKGSGSTGGSDQTPTPTVIQGSTKKNVQLLISAANQNGAILQVRTLISAVENTGVCTLSLSKEGQTTVTKTAGSQALSSNSTCLGFDIPISELSIGVWQLTIEYSSSNLVGSVTKNISIQ